MAQDRKTRIKTALKKNVVPFIICILVITFMCGILFRHYQDNSGRDLIAIVENKLLDLRFLDRGNEKPKSKVGILAIDESTLAKFGRWPISRKHYGPVLDNLKKLGVKWIGFDMVLSEPERADLGDVSQQLESLKGLRGKKLKAGVDASLQAISSLKEASPSDEIFSKAIADFENIVLGYFYFKYEFEVKSAGRTEEPFKGIDLMEDSFVLALPHGDLSIEDYEVQQVAGITSNIPRITESSVYHAFFNNEPDQDAVVRWVTLIRSAGENVIPSLALKTAAEAMDRDIAVFFDENGVEAIDLVNREDDGDTIKLPVDPHGVGRLLLNHRGRDQTIPHFSIAKAYDNSFSEKEKKYLKDSILLLGPTAVGINDQRPNPFDPALNGVENHVAAIDNIMSQDFMVRPRAAFETELYVIIILGIFLTPIILFSRATYSGFIAILILAGYYYFDKTYWFDQGYWYYMGIPVAEIVTLFVSVTLYKYATEEREKRKVKGTFSLYLSPEVIDQMLEDPDAMKRGGIRKEVTVFFSDVRGFTSISEGLAPEELCVYMNDYFTPMEEIIRASKGCLDKYIGDAIMAFWGAPIEIDDQADVAIKASVDMLFALEKIQADFTQRNLPPIDIGIGLNTGSVSVGNMGSKERFTYTVMGDHVNLGARLEGLTKEYGIRLMASSNTIDKATPGKFFIRDLDKIRVKGKNEPVQVYEILRPDHLPEAALKNLIGEFERGREFFLAQKWKEAEDAFVKATMISPNDGPSNHFLKEIEVLKTKPYIENWDGVKIYTHK